MNNEMWLDAYDENVPNPDEVSQDLTYLTANETVRKAPVGAVAAFEVGQAAAIRGKPTNPQEIDRANLEATIADPRDMAAADYYNIKKTQLAQNIQVMIGDSTMSVDAMRQGVEEQTRILNQQAMPNSKELAAAESYAPNADEEGRKELSFQLWAANDVSKMAEDTTWLEKASDFLGFIVPVADYKDTSVDVPNKVSADPELSPIAGDSLESIVARFHALSPESKANLWPRLKQAVLDASGGLVSEKNVLRASNILLGMLNPEGGTELQTEANKMLAFDVATTLPFTKIASGINALAKGGIKTLGTQIAKEAVSSVFKKGNPIKAATAAGDKEAAAMMNHAAMTDPKLASALGTSRDAAALNAMPIDMQQWVKEAADGLSPNEQALINADLSAADGFYRSLTSESDLIQIGALTKSERTYQMSTFMKELERKGEDFLNEGFALDGMKIVGENADGFTWQYTMRKVNPLDSKPKYRFNYETGKPEPVDTKLRYRFNYETGKPELVEDATSQVVTGTTNWSINKLTGNFNQTIDSLNRTGANTMGFEPGTWAAGGDLNDFGRFVMENARNVDLAKAHQVLLGQQVKWALEPLAGVTNVKARARLDAVLMHGDEFINPDTLIRGRVFTKQELANGFVINGKTVSLTRPEEVQAYYRARMVNDNMWRLQNEVVRKEKLLGGFMEVSIDSTWDGATNTVKMAAKPYDTLQAASMSVAKRPGYKVYNPATSTFDTITPELLEKEYAQGKVLARLDHDWSPAGHFSPGKEHVEYVLVEKARIKQLPLQVLPYKPGYVTKINKAQYAVKKTIPIIKAGVQNPKPKTVASRLFNNLEHANEFRMELATDYANKHGVSIEEALQHFPDPERTLDIPLVDRLEEAVQGHNGLFTGERSADDITFGLSGIKPDRVGALDSMKRYANHLARVVPRNELRIAMEKYWLNTVREKCPGARIAGFETTTLPSTASGRSAELLRRQIKEWNSIPSTQESMFQTAIQYTHDWLLHGTNTFGSRLGLQSKESIQSLLWLKHADPIAAIKGATTHLTMGSLNMIQIPLQASAAVVALTRRWGSHLTATTIGDVKHAFTFGILDNVRNETALGKIMKVLVANGEMDSRVVDAYKAWTRTGLYESTMSSLEGGIMAADGLGITMETLGKISDVGMIPYKIGDRFARRIAFIKEYAYWAEKHVGKKATDEDILQIVKEVDKDLLQLNEGHRAVWQGGANTGLIREIAGMATQYMQVATHTMELLLKGSARGGFTKFESFKIIAGQAMLFGAAGVPLVNLIAPQIQQALGLNEMSMRDATFINQGMLGLTLSSALGVNLDISQRFAIGSQLNEFLRDMMTSDDPIYLRALGASGTTGSRLFDAYKELEVLWTGDTSGNREMTLADLKQGIATFAAVASSTRNFYKAYVMHNAHVIMDRHGTVVTARDFDIVEELASAFGIQLTEVATINYLNMDKQTQMQMIRDAADVRVKLMYNALFVHKLDQKDMKNLLHTIQLSDEALDPAIRDEVGKAVSRKLWQQQDTKEDRAVSYFIKNTASSLLTDSALYDMQGIAGSNNLVVPPVTQLLRNQETK